MSNQTPLDGNTPAMQVMKGDSEKPCRLPSQRRRLERHADQKRKRLIQKVTKMGRWKQAHEKAARRSKRLHKKDGHGEPASDLASEASTLKVADYTVSCRVQGWQDKAFRIFKKSGFCVVEDVLHPGQCKEVLAACQAVAKEMIGPKQAGNRGRGRYSFGVASSTGSILHLPAIAGNLLNHGGLTLRPLLVDIFHKGGAPSDSDYVCYSGGGDFVLNGVQEYQRLHSDMEGCKVDKVLDVKMPPPFLSVNFCPQALTATNGPIRIVPGMYDWDGFSTEPARWKRSRLYPVPAGAALVRDVRILHGGTPNISESIRFMPSVEYASSAFSNWFPPWRCIPPDIYKMLDPEIRRISHELVEQAEPGAEPEADAVWYTRR